MKKFFLVLITLLICTSFKKEENLKWLGTFTLYVDEYGVMTIYYKGMIPQCMAKKLVDYVYVDCDTVGYTTKQLEESLNILLESDSCDNVQNLIRI